VSTKPEILPLTGLRGIAALMVVFNHYSAACASWPQDQAPGWLWIFSTGELGMTLFFTLSGFVIAYNYLDLDWRGEARAATARFVYLRLTRLYPALLVFFALMIKQTPQALRSFDWVLIHIAGIETWIPARLFGNLPVNSEPFNVSWSISTELMMYLLFAAAMIVFVRARWLAVVAGAAYVAAIVAIAVYLQDGNPLPLPTVLEDFDVATWQRWFFYTSPYYRLLEFGLGASAAIVHLRCASALEVYARPLALVAAVAVTSLVFLFVATQSPLALVPRSPLLQTTTAALLAAIFVNGAHDTKLNRALSAPWLVWVGTISYSLYLFHLYAHHKVGDIFPRALLMNFTVDFALSLAAALAIAFGMYRLVEVPARNCLRTRKGSARALGGVPVELFDLGRQRVPHNARTTVRRGCRIGCFSI
jgi:peptidoglycan/LPS O-acetylase OafA/YrhL